MNGSNNAWVRCYIAALALGLVGPGCDDFSQLATDSRSQESIGTGSPGGKKYYVAAMERFSGPPLAEDTVHLASDTVRLGMLTFYASQHGHHFGANARRVAWVGWAWRRGASYSDPDYCGPICAEGIGTWVGTDCQGPGSAPGTGEIKPCPNVKRFNNGFLAQQPAIGELRAALGYAASATDVRAGDYYVTQFGSSQTLIIRWDDGKWEGWALTTSSPDGIQKLELTNSTDGFTAGVAAGSNTPSNTRVHPVSIKTHPPIAGLDFTAFQPCSSATWVLGETHHVGDSSPCSCMPKHSYINNWLARVSTTDRRDVWHSWCQCLAFQADWYDGGSHQRMLLQAIDDTGAFRGWVGVQTDRNFSGAHLVDYLLDF